MPGSSTTPGRMGTRAAAPIRIAFRQENGVGARERVFIPVGTQVAPRPPDRSVRAQLRHTVLTLSGDAEPLVRPWVQHAR